MVNSISTFESERINSPIFSIEAQETEYSSPLVLDTFRITSSLSNLSVLAAGPPGTISSIIISSFSLNPIFNPNERLLVDKPDMKLDLASIEK